MRRDALAREITSFGCHTGGRTGIHEPVVIGERLGCHRVEGIHERLLNADPMRMRPEKTMARGPAMRESARETKTVTVSTTPWL